MRPQFKAVDRFFLSVANDAWAHCTARNIVQFDKALPFSPVRIHRFQPIA